MFQKKRYHRKRERERVRGRKSDGCVCGEKGQRDVNVSL